MHLEIDAFKQKQKIRLNIPYLLGSKSNEGSKEERNRELSGPT